MFALIAGCRSPVPPPSRLVVTVVDERCEWPLPGVRVVATAPHRREMAQTTGSDGTAIFRLSAGEWRLAATLPGAPPAEVRLRLGEPDARVTLPLRIFAEGTMIVTPHGPCTAQAH